MTLPVYLDYAATAPLDPRVRDVMTACMSAPDGFGNPSSATHVYGELAARHVQQAAAAVAALINAGPDDIVWTSGATEAINLAIIGAMEYRRPRGLHGITQTTEHQAALGSFAELESRGFAVTYLRPGTTGHISVEQIRAAIRADTTLVSVMLVNNETGVVQDIAAIGALCRERDVLLHVDAAQAVGRVKIDVRQQQADLVSLTAHKACGPKGIGALYMNRERIRRIEPLLYGGEQQRGLRPGTLPTHQIVGMGETYTIAADQAAENARVRALRDHLWQSVATLSGLSCNSDLINGHPGILSVTVAGVEGESLRLALRDIALASGSACSSASGEPSHVLRSLGLADHLAESTLRFSLGRFSTAAEIDRTIACVRTEVPRLQGMSPGGGRA